MKAEEYFESLGFNEFQDDTLFNSCDKSFYTVTELMDSYAELRIQQEREKWKEEVIKAYDEGTIDLRYATKPPRRRTAKEYYETEVKPRIESK